MCVCGYSICIAIAVLKKIYAQLTHICTPYTIYAFLCVRSWRRRRRWWWWWQWAVGIEYWPGQLSSLWRIFVPKVGAEGVEEVRVERDRDTAPGVSAGGSACGRAWMALTGVGMGNGTWTWGERVPVPTACCFPFPPAPAPTPTPPPPPPPTPAPTPTPAPPTPTPTPPLLALLALRLLSDTHGLNSHVLF